MSLATFSNQENQTSNLNSHILERRLKFILFATILVTPLFDLATGYYQLVDGGSSWLTPSVIYRGIVLMTVFGWFTLQIQSSLKIFIIYLSMVFAVSTGANLLSGNSTELIAGLQRYLKLIYPLLGLGTLLYFSTQYNLKLFKKALWQVGAGYGAIVCIAIIVTFLTGTGLSAYAKTNAFSNAAYFDSQNGLSIVFGISLLMMLYYIQTYVNRAQMALMLAADCVWLLSAFLLSTRTAIVIIPTFIILFHTFILFDSKDFSLFKLISRIFVISAIVLIGYQIYQFWQGQNIQYHLQKFEQLSDIDFRRKVPIGLEQLAEYNLLEHLFGGGEGHFILTETDLLDIYGKFGLLTLLPIVIYFGSYVVQLLLIFLQTRKLSTYILLLSFSIYGLHGAFAGHAFANAIVNNLFIVIYFLAYVDINEITTAPGMSSSIA
ncbi:MAG: O-antigen ligase family protein [Caldilineaceae bacterium]